VGTLRCTISHSGRTVNGVLLGEPAEPAFLTYDDPALPNGLLLDDGTVLPFDTAVDESTEAVTNRENIRTAARQALIDNRDFIQSSPTNAQTLAQVKDLSRQMNGVIRLLLGALDGTD